MGRTRRGHGGNAVKWIRGSMNKIDLVEDEKKIAYIVYQNYKWMY